MSLEVSKYDVLYGRLLKLGVAVDQAKALSKVLYDISIQLGVTTDELLKYVNTNGLRYDNEVYALLNNVRTNSSQLGFIDQNNISPAITRQVPDTNIYEIKYVVPEYIEPDYVE